MKKLPHQLIFISQINRDGSGTSPLSEDYQKSLLENPLMNKEYLDLHCLSLTEGTYIAHGFNSFVVQLKELSPREKAGKALKTLNKYINFKDDEMEISRPLAVKAMEEHSKSFLEWAFENGWELLGDIDNEKWVNVIEHSNLLNSGEKGYYKAIKKHGISTNLLYNIFNTSE